MQIPEGYTKLATIGMADKGIYSESGTYYYLNTVFYNGSTYTALKDNPEGTPSNDGINWKLVAQGASKNISLESVAFDEALKRSNIQSGDTLGEALGKISKMYNDLNNVAFSGSYNDLTDKPDIPSKPEDIGAVALNGDTKDNTVTFESADTDEDKFAGGDDVSAVSEYPVRWTHMPLLESGKTHGTFLNWISIAFKNLRYIGKFFGSTDISEIGDGTVTGALSELNSRMVFLSEEEYQALGDKVDSNTFYFTPEED